MGEGRGGWGWRGGETILTDAVTMSHYLNVVAAKEIDTNVYVDYGYEGDWEETINSM